MACISCGNPTCRGCHVEHNHVHINHTHADKCGGHSHSHGHSNSTCQPCGTSAPECESLSSQITNFTKQFFGEVVKTELNGVISWSLPCNLDVGLDNNPRLDGEGLACYFLRLFQEGIVGLTGPEGSEGQAGANGRNAYTVTLAGFIQPSESNPNVQVSTSYNPAILEGMYIFIGTSGWYVVNVNDTSGMLFLTFAEASADSPPAGTFISAGKLVVPSGFPGAGVQGPAGTPGAQGPQGVQGIQGIQGPAGVAETANNGLYNDPAGTDYNLQVAYSQVTFTTTDPEITLTDSGEYLVTVVVGLVGLAGVATTNNAFLKLFNTTTAADVPASEHRLSEFVDTARHQLVINTIVTTTSTGEVIALYGRCPAPDVIAVVADNTTITFVKIAT